MIYFESVVKYNSKLFTQNQNLFSCLINSECFGSYFLMIYNFKHIYLLQVYEIQISSKKNFTYALLKKILIFIIHILPHIRFVSHTLSILV